MDPHGRATRIALSDFASPPMRAFHMSWLAFFASFVAWFAIAPLMPLIREDLSLSKEQVGNSVIASVAITIFVRLVVGRLLDRFGPRRVYSALLLRLGARDGDGARTRYGRSCLLRMAISAIGASFVVTQYTSLVFAPGVVGTASARAGWETSAAAPRSDAALLGVLVSFGVEATLGWRLTAVMWRRARAVRDGRPVRATRRTRRRRTSRISGAAERGAGSPSFWSAARDPRVRERSSSPTARASGSRSRSTTWRAAFLRSLRLGSPPSAIAAGFGR
jgi:MFS family permease